MTNGPSLLPAYLEHLQARVRGESRTTLPAPVSRLCTEAPAECLSLIIAALGEARSPNLIAAVGDGLLENLLNEHSEDLRAAVADLLRTNETFRFAFASGTHASVDTLLIDEWLAVFRELGTTKGAERKRLWSRRV